MIIFQLLKKGIFQISFNNLLHTFDISTGRVRILEDISQTRGTPFVSGVNWNSTPLRNGWGNKIQDYYYIFHDKVDSVFI